MARIIEIPRFNTILDKKAREHYEPVVRTLWALAPEMMARKIPEANVQQAFVLAAVLQLCPNLPQSKILCVGCYEDTAYQALLQMGYSVEGIDPNTDGRDLHAYLTQNGALAGTFDAVFSTSVLEHVDDDCAFVSEISKLLRESGVAILTCDFLRTWKQGDPLPASDFRFYTPTDLRERLVAQMDGCVHIDDGDWEDHEADFEFVGLRYAFASLVVRKSATS